MASSPDSWPEPESRLPIAGKVWQVSEKYNKGGPTVARALYEAIVELEVEALRLRSAK